GLRVDVGVDPQRDPRPGAGGARDPVDRLELLGAFDVERADPGLERAPDLGFGLADSREHDLAGVAARAHPAHQLAVRHDVGAGAQLDQHTEDAEARVGLDRVAHAVRDTLERGVERAVRALQLGAAVHVDWRADLARDPRERHLLAAQLVVSIFKRLVRNGCGWYRKRGALRIKPPPPRPAHHAQLGGPGAAAEQPIATIGFQPADRGPARHREPGLDRAGVRIDAAELAVVTFPHAVPQLAVDPGHAGDVAVGLQRPQDLAGRGIGLVDLAIALLAHPH